MPKSKTTVAKRYPWEKWFKNHKFKLVRGVDYHCAPHGMAQQIRNYAVRKRLRVSIQVRGDTLHIINWTPVQR